MGGVAGGPPRTREGRRPDCPRKARREVREVRSESCCFLCRRSDRGLTMVWSLPEIGESSPPLWDALVTTLTGLTSNFVSRRRYVFSPKCPRPDPLPTTLQRPLPLYNSVLGSSLVGSTKGTRTTSASTTPTAGSWTLTWVPRFQWERGMTARAMFESWAGDQKALVT